MRTVSRLYPGSPRGMFRNRPYPNGDRPGESNSRDSRWSSSPVADNEDNAFNVNFNNGNVNNDKHVRCVR